MLPHSYPFVHVMDEKVNTNGHLSNLLYRFKSTKSNISYIVCVEHYKYNVFVVKFYPKSWRDSKRKYQLLTRTNEPRRIIYTCINIMLTIFDRHPTASFGFVGANRIGEKPRETKRYRVYSTFVATYFSDKLFVHKEDKDKSAYLLVNRSVLSKDPLLISKIEGFFNELFVF